MLRAGENYLLDDVTLPQIEEELGVQIDIIKQAGYHLVSELFGIDVFPKKNSYDEFE